MTFPCSGAWADSVRHVARLLMACLALALASGRGGAAELPEGRKDITLVASDGAKQRIGSVEFVKDGDGAKVAVTLDAPEFSEEFLAMRPFRCLRDNKEMWCHVQYPYEWRGRITPADLVDLEYALIFLFRPQGSYGIDAWNGLYFKLAIVDGGLNGELHEVDLNVLAIPPDAGTLRPIGKLTPSTENFGHRFMRMEIR